MITFNSKFGEIIAEENLSGLGYDIRVQDQLIGLYTDELDQKDIEEWVSSVYNKGKKTVDELKSIDNISFMVISKEKISEQIDEWVHNFLQPSFKFRPHQKEIIIDIISNIVNDEGKNRNHMVEAPTGSGKSLVNIISAGVLDEYYGFTSYILCSDLYLWDQYDAFIKANPKLKMASIKGQTGNYECMLNHEDIRNADCKMANISWRSLITGKAAELYGYDCCFNCEYVKARKKALKRNVVMMTYQLYLYSVNVLAEQVKQSGGDMDVCFQPKDIIFCDECHNIPGIVQANYTPEIKKEDNIQFMALYDYYNAPKELELFSNNENNDLDDAESKSNLKIYKKYKTRDAIEKELLQLYYDFLDEKVNKYLLFETIEKYYNLLCLFNSIAKNIIEDINKKKQCKEDVLTKEDIKAFKTSNWMLNKMCFWNDFFSAISATGHEYVVKDIIEPQAKQTEVNPDKYTELHCTKEDYMVYAFLLSKTRYRVFISATMGGKAAFEENNGIHYTEEKTGKFQIVPSIFNFEKSPIYLLNKFKMTMKERKQNLPKILNVINQICSSKFKDERGIIQTGSYEIAKAIYYGVSPEVRSRLLLYRGSKEKIACVKLHCKSKNTILIGPTLNQGMDLPDDKCRFIIISKVPYPSLGSNLVREKQRLFKLWYESVTSNEIIQGIGRGVRNENDYCTTYILDACFMELYKSTLDQYPPEIQDRLQIIG